MGRIITINKGYLKRFQTRYFREPECHKCEIPLVVGMEVFRSDKHLYCIPCSEIMYYDSSISVTDEELEDFFKIVN